MLGEIFFSASVPLLPPRSAILGIKANLEGGALEIRAGRKDTKLFRSSFRLLTTSLLGETSSA
jgi:hypothetical protein